MVSFSQSEHNDVLKFLDTNKSFGLSYQEVESRQQSGGFNVIEWATRISPRKILLDQFKDPLVIVLILATVVSALVGDHSGAIIILIIVLLNGIIGFIQEYNSEKSIESLSSMMSLEAITLRDGKKITLDARELVVGDIVFVDAWDTIAADGRLLQANNLKLAESILTWESLAVEKHSNSLSKDSTLAEQYNMVFSWTSVVQWFGIYVVTNIGMNTELGKIAKLIDEVEDKQTHLQKKLDKLGKQLGIAVVAIALIIFLSYYVGHNVGLTEAFLAAVALWVAAIPEWLPAVVTLSLSLGVKRMAKKQALVRKLPSVETLGSVDIICADKTWTLTKNEMTVKEIYVDHSHIHVQWIWYTSDWSIDWSSSSLEQLLKIWLLCNHASVFESSIVGDATEAALIVAASKWWYTQESFGDYHYIDEIPFDSTRKMMTSIYQKNEQYYSFSKWAPEMILDKLTYILEDGEVRRIKKSDKKKILTQNELFAEGALRVLAFAYKVVDIFDKPSAEDELIFVGLQALIDPARQEVKSSIAQAHEAGIRVIMITWDNKKTAQAIARQLDLSDEALTWPEIDTLSDKQLLKKLKTIGIFARVTPAHKQRLVKLLQTSWSVVAMTWDGVNDAPALKQADIWIAMGITGTDVSKQAADVILLDDNFSTIIQAVEEWRGIYDNIKKFVNYMFSTNASEVLILFVMAMLWFPLPLLAIHLLWINLVTDGPPALALGIDPIDSTIMKRKPLPSSNKILDAKMIQNIVFISLIITGVVVIFFVQWQHIDLSMARSGVMILLVILEIMRVQMIRADYHVRMFANPWLRAALGMSLLATLAIVYTPLAQYFHTKAPSALMWRDILIYALIAYTAGMVLTHLHPKSSPSTTTARI